MNRFIAQILPIPIYLEICDLDLSNEIQYLETVPFSPKDEQGRKSFGEQSENTYILNESNLVLLRNWIIDRLNDYARNIMLFDVDDMAITQSWVSMKLKNQGHQPHTHSNSLISGVFYWQDKIEPINFVRQDNHYISVEDLPMAMSQDPINSKQISASVTPKKNSLILFPSNLIHFVEENPFEEKRYSLAFNSIPLKGFGSEPMLNEINLQKIYSKGN